MDNNRLILVMGLGFFAIMLWQAWQNDYGPKRQALTPPAQSTPAKETAQAPSTGEIPSVPNSGTISSTDNKDSVAPQVPSPTGSAPVPVPAPQTSPVASSGGKIINVETDTFKIKIDTKGGQIVQVRLKKYADIIKPKRSFILMDNNAPLRYAAQSGLRTQSPGQTLPNHESLFSVEKDSFVLDQGEKILQVPMRWKNEAGIEVVKTYVFHQGSYIIDLKHKVDNGSSAEINVDMYAHMRRSDTEPVKKSSFIYTYFGAAYYNETDKFEKIDFDDIKDASDKGPSILTTNKGGWTAIIQHYYVSAWLPQANDTYTYYTNYLKNSNLYQVGLVSPGKKIAAQGNDEFAIRIFIGPKLQEQLAKAAPGLDLTVDYGMFTFLSQPLFWLLTKLHSWFGNWGLAIILVTLIIKLIFYKLSETSYRSMANMKRLQPRMAALKERYGDDRQKFGQAMMDLYKQEKVNPLGGCLPILIQIPVFLALYWVLLEAVELHQAPFFLWITDLSSKDPFYILPLLMGVTMFLQQKLNPPQMDPVHQKIMQILPIVFTLFIAVFPAGLVLYWVANNILSIAQQWYITRRIEQQAANK